MFVNKQVALLFVNKQVALLFVNKQLNDDLCLSSNS
jgi:hypothetical protein